MDTSIQDSAKSKKSDSLDETMEGIEEDSKQENDKEEEEKEENEDTTMEEINTTQEKEKSQDKTRRRSSNKTLITHLAVFAKFSNPKNVFMAPQLHDLYLKFLMN